MRKKISKREQARRNRLKLKLIKDVIKFSKTSQYFSSSGLIKDIEKIINNLDYYVKREALKRLKQK